MRIRIALADFMASSQYCFAASVGNSENGKGASNAVVCLVSHVSAEQETATTEAPRLLKDQLRDKLPKHRRYICEHNQDLPEITEWRWKAQCSV